MRAEPSKLARLVIAYHEQFGRHVPLLALRLRDAEELAAILQDSLVINLPLAETGWSRASPIEFGPYRRGGCCIMDENPERATPTKLPTGEWLH